MNDDNRQLLRTFAQLGSLGFTLVLTTFTGLGAGLLLDKWTGLDPLFTIGCLLLGIIGGFLYMFYRFGANAKKK